MENARAALDLLIEKRLSKYNLPDVGDPTRHFAVKTRRRVLVLGQVDNDAAVRMGNPAGWRMSDMVRLAKLENPNAEILYRPHPEIYKGYQRSRLKADQIERFARIVSPDGPLIDLFETVDHVYTLSSLSGLEALLRGLEVTTLGTPFYAGWGLTDDRTQKHRGRSLTVLELFAGVYLKYPRYLADIANSYIGFQAAAFRVLGDRSLLQITRDGSTDRSAASLLDPSELAKLASAQELSPMALLARITGYEKGAAQALNSGIKTSLTRLFVEKRGEHFHRIAATIIATTMDNEQTISILETILPHMDGKSANALLVDLYVQRPEIDTAKLFSQIAEGNTNKFLSLELYDHLSKNDQEFDNEKSEADTPEKRAPSLSQAQVLRQRSKLLFETADFQSALDHACAATMIDGNAQTLLELAANASWQLFDPDSAYNLAHLGMLVSGPQTAWALRLYWRTCPYVSFYELLDEAALCASIKPNMIPNAATRLEEIEGVDTFGVSKTAILKSHILAFNFEIPYVQTLLELGRFEEALQVIQSIASDKQTYQSAVAASRCLCYLDRYTEAETLIDQTLSTHKNSLVYDEALKICLYTGKYKKAQQLLSEATSRKIDLGHTLPLKISLGVHRYADGFRTYREINASKEFALAYSEKHVSRDNYNSSGKSVVLLPLYGPGDEIRFASTYNAITKKLGFKEVSIGVEPRLHELFSRSFSESGIKFFPTQRILRNERAQLDNYDNLPFASLMAVMDNKATELCKNAERVGLVTDLLADLLSEASDFAGSAYLKADYSRSREFRNQLPSGTPLVGLNWRSSITLQSRKEHYLSVEDLMPIFENTNAQFVNLQYDDCEEEVEYINKHYPGRLINISNLDQYNDLDGVASLISCLDLVIAPCTTVAELSGALGQETLLFANSSEIEWRVRAVDKKDIWHHSMEHVFGERYRDKESLVLALIDRLNSWLARS